MDQVGPVGQLSSHMDQVGPVGQLSSHSCYINFLPGSENVKWHKPRVQQASHLWSHPLQSAY
jgi:hypothetical protein